MLDLDALDAEFARIVQGTDGKSPVVSALASAYDAYAKGATIKGASCAAGGNLSLLVSAFTSDNSPGTMLNMAAKLCAYWQALPKVGLPAHGGVAVVSAVPSFQTLNSVVYAAIAGCVTTSQFDKPYKRLFKAVEDALKTAPIVITETMPNGSPTAFTEYLS